MPIWFILRNFDQLYAPKCRQLCAITFVSVYYNVYHLLKEIPYVGKTRIKTSENSNEFSRLLSQEDI